MAFFWHFFFKNITCFFQFFENTSYSAKMKFHFFKRKMTPKNDHFFSLFWQEIRAKLIFWSKICQNDLRIWFFGEFLSIFGQNHQNSKKQGIFLHFWKFINITCFFRSQKDHFFVNFWPKSPKFKKTGHIFAFLKVHKYNLFF